MKDQLLEYRKEFPILDTCTYMVSHSLGAMPRGVHARLAEFASLWETRGVLAWSDAWWRLSLTVGDTLGEIFGAGQ